MNFEYNRNGEEPGVTNTSGTGHDNIGKENYQMAGYYVLKDLDLGLVQRPKAQLKVTKQITKKHQIKGTKSEKKTWLIERT